MTGRSLYLCAFLADAIALGLNFMVRAPSHRSLETEATAMREAMNAAVNGQIY
jgi:hypothetical protein